MTNDFWNSRFSEPGYAYGTEPNAFLTTQTRHFQPGMKALAVADGEGRNGVWLAQQGLDVLSVDGSEVGLRKARELAQSRGVSIHTELAELTRWQWPENAFDIVVAIFIHFPPEHRARMHANMLRALKPGGVLIMEAFTPEQLEYKTGGPPVREMLYSVEMVCSDFDIPACAEVAQGKSPGTTPVTEILLLQQTVTELHEGPYHRGQAAVVRLVVKRRPL
ncbi:MAG: class I SAM-dependent methyltransferase [Gammaproteobacteria bacterium]|nr:class I SAM-dependent methyltransferase [Gammaproteobacteria bacterium]